MSLSINCFLQRCAFFYAPLAFLLFPSACVLYICRSLFAHHHVFIAVAFTGVAVMNTVLSIQSTVWAFRQHPNFIFCTSPTDPCSCVGGGFNIFATYCNKTVVVVNISNVSYSSSDNVTITADAVVVATEAQTMRVSIFDAVDSNAVIIFTSIGALVIIVLIFGQARAIIATANANDAKAIAEAKLIELRETNLKIRKEL